MREYSIFEDIVFLLAIIGMLGFASCGLWLIVFRVICGSKEEVLFGRKNDKKL